MTALIQLITDDDDAIVSGPGYRSSPIQLDVSPTGMFSTAFTLRTISGAFQIGGRPAGTDIPVREVTLPFHLHDAGDGIEATISRFRRMWRMGQTVTFMYTSDLSGSRWLKLRISKEIGFTSEVDWNNNQYVQAVVSAVALQPMYESAEDIQSFENPSSGEHTGYLTIWNPTPNPLWLEWAIDPATEVQFPDFSWGQEKRYRRPADADAARMIVTPELTQKLSVMADPMMDTYISEDLSNAAGLFNGVEPLYPVPAYTEPTVVPVTIDGAAGASVVCTMRRFWTAEAGEE
jgi:hypothetical protein